MSSVKCLCCEEEGETINGNDTKTKHGAGFLLKHKTSTFKHIETPQTFQVLNKGSLKMVNVVSALTTQQALPRSAILTCNLSALTGSRGFTNTLPDAPVEERWGRQRQMRRRSRKVKGIMQCKRAPFLKLQWDNLTTQDKSPRILWNVTTFYKPTSGLEFCGW